MSAMPMVYEFKRRVPFHDLDPLQIVWHGNYLKYFDIARFGLFKQAGLDLYQYFLDRQLIFPVTRSSAKHIVPLRYDDEFVCKATVTEAVYKIAMSFEIRLAGNGQICTRGKSEQVAVKMPEMEMQFEVPGDVTTALGFA
ncbi:MAG: thioesterase family protein [Desulfobacterales bacterium]|jgi:acyl-CoA thioester hydrolase